MADDIKTLKKLLKEKTERIVDMRSTIVALQKKAWEYERAVGMCWYKVTYVANNKKNELSGATEVIHGYGLSGALEKLKGKLYSPDSFELKDVQKLNV